nr:immunoglobulin heavy chain junction region [Macaca mulatta]MOV49252.1 immunoglobulin heavy chain junction region [Macaca mulatta]MOV49430.1 immunoglobulin heavy chain junction region [Macaca mulatta]MOV50114.1 immunoglobulin heavy chain junction region [Macaca mulatta]MOV50160.1 immunoglobulin heavy chain junction region [Macaca mulatta]
CARGAEPIDYW